MLHQPETGRRFGTRLEGTSVVRISGLAGKEKETKKSFANVTHGGGPLWTAINFAAAEERKRLRQGYVIVDPQAASRTPVMLRSLGATYTGAMPVLTIDGSVLCTIDSPTFEGTEILFVDAEAKANPVVTLPPKELVWKLVAPSDAEVLMLVDHGVQRLRLDPATVEEMVPRNELPASFLTCAAGRAAWFEYPDIVVVDLESGAQLLRYKAEPEMYGGQSLVMQGELCPDGSLLAVQHVSGVIDVVEVETGVSRHTLVAEFGIARHLRFTPDGSTLFASTFYGSANTLFCFDLVTGKPRRGWPERWDLVGGSIDIDPTGQRVVAAGNHGVLHIIDVKSGAETDAFPVDQAGRWCSAAWLDATRVAVRTSFGFIAMYDV